MNANRSTLIAVMTSMALSSAPVSAIELVSTNALGQQGARFTNPRPNAISNDGNTVLFYSCDGRLVQHPPGPLPVQCNYYVKNMATGAIVAVIKRPDGLALQAGAGGNSFARLDEPPTRVVFKTSEPNLTPGTPTYLERIFSTVIGSYQYVPARGIVDGPGMQFYDFTANSRLDRLYLSSIVPIPGVTGGLQIAEVSTTLPTLPIIHTLRPDGQTTTGGGIPRENQIPSISVSGDGRMLTWWGAQFDVDPDPSGSVPVNAQIFIRDTQLGVTRQVRSENGQSLPFVEFPNVSEDGSFVAFGATANFAAPCLGDGIYGIDTRTWRRECISVNTAGEPAEDISYQLAVSADGNRVVFGSTARNLGPNFPNQPFYEFGVFVRDRRLQRTVRIDINAQGIPANGGSPDPFDLGNTRYPKISLNGRWVVFSSDASNLVPNDTNGHAEDIYRVDLNRFLPDPSLGAARLMPVPALSMMASFGLIVALLGFGIWRRRD